jgi:hypothetical protein
MQHISWFGLNNRNALRVAEEEGSCGLQECRTSHHSIRPYEQ